MPLKQWYYMRVEYCTLVEQYMLLTDTTDTDGEIVWSIFGYHCEESVLRKVIVLMTYAMLYIWYIQDARKHAYERSIMIRLYKYKQIRTILYHSMYRVCID